MTRAPGGTTTAYHPRAHPRGKYLVQPALTRAVSLVSIVRDEDAAAVARILDPLDRQALYALVTVMAALIPDDQTVPQLTAWVHDAMARHRLSGAV